jgi:hypothetical protein
MESVMTALKDTPIPTILVIAGIAFLLLSIAGQLAGRIAVAPERQRWAAIIGGGLLAIGVTLHVVPQVRPTSPPPPPPPPPVSLGPQPIPSPPKPSVLSSTEETEPNDHMANATLMSEGTTVRGAIATDEDQDFFKFTASSTKTRVILRKHFSAYMDVYDHVENRIASKGAARDQTLSLAFESGPGLLSYIVVKPGARSPRGRGNYELVIQRE